MSADPVQAFCEWADENAIEGQTSEGKKAKYVPHSAQSEYWNTDKIKDIIISRGSITSATDIQNYVCIFSILVYLEGQKISALHYLEQIMKRGGDDASLPWIPWTETFNVRRDIFQSTDDLERFIDTQWMFYPMPAQPFLTAGPTMTPRVFLPNAIHNREVQLKQIFPISEDLDRPTDASRGTRRVTVSYKLIHTPASKLEAPIAPISVVFKKYPPVEEETYKDERNGYTATRDAPHSDHILKCLGSFFYCTGPGQRFSTIMTELADSGTLWDLFKGNQVPYRKTHIYAMWESFSGALHGLATIHNQGSENAYICFHSDLKPSNLFLFAKAGARDPFHYTIKIGDFGSSHAQSTKPAFHVYHIRDKGATRTYGPPETHLGDVLNYHKSREVDMWAIGCMIIEMAVWITGGKLALDEFRRERMEGTKDLPILQKSGQDDCFHDGDIVLEAVKRVRNTVNENRRPHDYITPAMVDLALEFVLIPKKERLYVDQLIPKFWKALREPSGQGSRQSVHQQYTGQTSPPGACNSQPTEQSWLPNSSSSGVHGFTYSPPQSFTRSPPIEMVTPPPASSSMPPLESTTRPSILPVQNAVTIGPPPNVRQEIPRETLKETPRELPEELPTIATKTSSPHISIDELQKWVNNSKTQNNGELPGRDEAKLLLDGRDFIFLIDNSKHTRGYKEEVKTWTTNLAYLLKSIDPDGMDVANTSSPQAAKTIKTKTDMSKFVEQTFAREIGADCMIENALGIIFAQIKAKWTQRQGSTLTGRRTRFSIPGIGQRAQTSQGVTILVFTNGVWDATSDGTSGAGQTILDLIKWMQVKEIPRTQISIQFVRLGSEQRGIRRLKILDDELKKDFDIVDTKPVTASIWDILIGPMQAGTDNDVATSS